GEKGGGWGGADEGGGVFGVGAAGLVVGMVNRLFDTQHPSKTDIGSLKQTTPMVAGIACEQLRKPCLQAAPLIAIVLCGRINVVELQFLQEQSVELRFQCADCDEPPVRADIGVIKGES